jgi:hypothetical protein
MNLTSFIVFDLLKEKTKAFSFDIEKLKKLEHAKNGELRSNSYTKKLL